jgi:hypothetical protein
VCYTKKFAALSYAERLLEAGHQAKKAREDTSRYRKVSHVVATSNTCERLFSQAKLLMSSLRRKMEPATLNMLLFLKHNIALWPDARLIQEIINDRADLDIDEGSDDEEVESVTSDEEYDEDVAYLGDYI